MLWLTVLLGCAFRLAPECDSTLDVDADGLDECLEAWLGTSPDLADTDGDGVSDGAEFDCVSDPLDSAQQCYACGWPHADPKNLTGIGPAIGSTLANLTMVDQCGEDVALHDLTARYHILFVAPLGCTDCWDEATALAERATTFEDDFGVPFSYVAVVTGDAGAGAPSRDAAATLAQSLSVGEAYPVLADLDQEIWLHTPFDGNAVPARCALTPRMKMLDCTSEPGDDQVLFERILTDVLNQGQPPGR